MRDRTGVKGVPLAELESQYRERYGDFLRTAAAIAGSVDAGRDAVHDAFVSAVRARGSYRGEGTVEAWLWRTVVTSALKLRRRRHDVPLELAPEPAAPSGDADDVEAARQAIGALPERQRLALFLRYYADLDYATIADVLGIAGGTVAATLHSAHAAVRARLEEVEAR